MPLPIFYLEFYDKHGRDPGPGELSQEERRLLLKCCLENIERDASVEAVLAQFDKNIATLTEAREALLAQHQPDSERWHALIETSVGLSLDTDPKSTPGGQ